MACGLWLGYYAVDSQHQKQTYETLAEDFLLEEPESSLSLAENDSPEQSSTTQETVVTLTTAPPRHDLAALQAENPDCVAGSPFRTRPWTTPWCGRPATGALPAPGLLRQFRQWWHALPRRAKPSAGKGTEPYCIRPQYAGRSMFKAHLYSVWSQVSDKHTRIFTWN